MVPFMHVFAAQLDLAFSPPHCCRDDLKEGSELLALAAARLPFKDDSLGASERGRPETLRQLGGSVCRPLDAAPSVRPQWRKMDERIKASVLSLARSRSRAGQKDQSDPARLFQRALPEDGWLDGWIKRTNVTASISKVRLPVVRP